MKIQIFGVGIVSFLIGVFASGLVTKSATISHIPSTFELQLEEYREINRILEERELGCVMAPLISGSHTVICEPCSDADFKKRLEEVGALLGRYQRAKVTDNERE